MRKLLGRLDLPSAEPEEAKARNKVYGCSIEHPQPTGEMMSHTLMQMLMPGSGGQQMPQSREEDHVDRIPSRVLVAIKYFENLFAHQAAVVVHSHPGVGECRNDAFPGNDLDLDHQAARKAACDMMIAFFSGSFRPEPWELPPSPEARERGTMIHCVGCGGGRSARPDGEQCELCRGTGNILVFPCSPR